MKKIIIILSLIIYSCNSLHKEYVYYPEYYLNHKLGSYYKLVFKEENHSFIFYKNTEKDTLRLLSGSWMRRGDRLLIDYELKDSINLSKISYSYDKNIKKGIKLNIQEKLLDTLFNLLDKNNKTNTHLYINDKIAIINNHNIINYDHNKIRFIRISFMDGEICFKSPKIQYNKLAINISTHRILFWLPFIESGKFLIKGNKLYPIYDCSQTKIYKDVYFSKKRKKYKRIRKHFKDSLWHPSW